MIQDDSKRNFICIYNNIRNDKTVDKNVGTKINIKTKILADICANCLCYDISNIIYNKEKFKNRIILSNIVDNNNVTLLTQQNLIHNIKFIHKDNDFTKPRIVFTKYNVINDFSNDNQFLVTSNTDLSNININGVNLDFQTATGDIGSSYGSNTYADLERLNYHFNFYKIYENSDYYKIKFSDFIDLSYIKTGSTTIDDNCYNKLKIEPNSIQLTNNFSGNNLYNYDISNFEILFNHKDLSENDINPITIGTDITYENDNILLYNQLNNISTVNLTYKYDNNNINNYDDASINFIVLKGHHSLSKNTGKIFLNKDFTYANTRVLDYNSNFYDNNSTYEDLNNKGIVFLSLGNLITGITQRDLFTRTKIELNDNKTGTKKILFGPNITSSVSNEKKYLLDENYNYDYTNITYTTYQEREFKLTDISLLDYYQPFLDSNLNLDFSNNLFQNKFNSLEVLNTELSNNYFDNNTYNPNNVYFTINDNNDISLDTDKYRLTVDHQYSNNLDSIFKLVENNTEISNKLFYDFKFNYNATFDLVVNLTARYKLSGNELLNELSDFSKNLLLNFNKIVLTSYIETTGASDFTNVDCIFIHHDPKTTTDPSYQYPNNNIEIVKNPNIDTLSKAIELLPGAKTSTTNSVFIPAKNGSNLSRKMIQGLIGLNNIPKLLSIEPYDENFIVGRDTNIDPITGEWPDKTDAEIVQNKYDSQKHSSQKKIVASSSKKTNFANLVRRNKLSSGIRSNLLNTQCQQQIDASGIKPNNYYTPFRLFTGNKLGQGNYL